MKIQDRANRYDHGDPKPMFGNISKVLAVIYIIVMIVYLLFEWGFI